MEVKNAGWIPLQSSSGKPIVTSFFEMEDKVTRLIKARDISSILDNCSSCEIYTVERAFVYESLVSTTSKYDINTGTTSASVSSVVTF